MEYIQANIIWILLILIVLWVIFSYNSLVRVRNRAKEAWSDISVQLKRRYDLIPNLVETVKGYAAHEKNVLEEVTAARTTAMGAGTKADQAQAENQLSQTIKSLFAVAENYPDLKANTNFLELQRELSDTENKIQASRRFYNSMVLALNTKIQTFPTNIISALFGFKAEEFFETESEKEKEPIKVSF